MRKFLSSLDFIGNKITLTNHGSKSHKSCLGGLLSIILSILSIITVGSFGIELFKKENPKVNLDYNYSLKPSLNLTNFPLMVYIGQRGDTPLDDFQKYFNVTMLSFENSTNHPIEKKMRICKDEDFHGMKSEFMEAASPLNQSYYFCLENNQELHLRGELGTKDVSSISVVINKCTNITDKIQCKPDKEIDHEMRSMIVKFYVGDYYFDSENFNEPGQKYLKLLNFEITSLYYKHNYIFLRNVDYTTDKGLIFEDKNTKSYHQVESFKEQIFINKEYAYTPQTISQVTLTLSPLKQVHIRSYYKFQKLAADVGGLLKTFLIVCNFFVEFANRSFINYFMVNQIFDLSIQENSKKNDISDNCNGKNNKVTTFNRLPANDISIEVITTNIHTNRKKMPDITFFDYICLRRVPVRTKQLCTLIVNRLTDVKHLMRSMSELEVIKRMYISKDQGDMFMYIKKNYFLFKQFEDENDEYKAGLKNLESTENLLNRGMDSFGFLKECGDSLVIDYKEKKRGEKCMCE